MTSSLTNTNTRSMHLILPVLLLILIGGASFALYLPVFHWLLLKMSLANGYLHIVALLGVLGLAAYRLLNTHSNPFHFPVLFHSGSLIWISATLLYLLNEANVGFHTMSAALFIAYIYGLTGHFISTALWRSMLLPVLLLILVLPFEHYLDIYLGFPLRLLSAQWASSLLQFTQLPLMTVESILMVDSKAAIVDLDCSGINSLWIGLIFYLLLTWVERFAINLRWMMIGLGFMLLLILSNVFRIVILVMLDLVFELPKLAQLFHQSLGLLGFVISSLIIMWVLNRFAEKRKHKDTNLDSKPAPNSFTLGAILTLITLFVFLYQPYQASSSNSVTSATNHAQHTLNLPSEYVVKTTEMSVQEKEFFVSNHAQAQKYSIDVAHNQGSIKASMVLVWSTTWKTHHVPENCYISQGYTIFDQGLWRINKQHNMRYLSLNKPVINSHINNTVHTQTGVYWFQSARRSTPDYSSRVMDNLFHPASEWVMVSILWDRSVKPDEINTFITILKLSLESQFNESP